MTIPIWVFVVLVLLAVVGVAVTVLLLLVLAALGAHYRPDRITPLETDEPRGRVIDGRWN